MFILSYKISKNNCSSLLSLVCAIRKQTAIQGDIFPIVKNIAGHKLLVFFFENHDKTHSYIASTRRKKNLCRGRLLRNVITTRH